MNYKTIPGIAHMYDILETKTNQIIATKPEHNDEAKKLCRHLNMGGGFDSWTPAFFLENITVHKASMTEGE